MAHRRKIIAWGVGLGLLVGVASAARSEEPDKTHVSIDADHEPLLAVIKRICAAQGLGFVANDAALDKAGKISLSLHDVPLETALDVICEAYSLEARVRNKILVVRPRTIDAPAADAAPRKTRSLPEERREQPAPGPATPEGPKLHVGVERDPTPPAPPATSDTAPISTVVIHSQTSGSTTGGGYMIVGTVVEIGKDSLKVKETSGEPREFLIAHDDDGGRASKLGQALRRLKTGDRVALEYRVVEGRAYMTNLVGGGNPQQKP